MSKRQFPYHSAVEELHIQKRQTTVAGVNPGIAKAAPRIFEGQHTEQVPSSLPITTSLDTDPLRMIQQVTALQVLLLHLRTESGSIFHYSLCPCRVSRTRCPELTSHHGLKIK